MPALVSLALNSRRFSVSPEAYGPYSGHRDSLRQSLNPKGIVLQDASYASKLLPAPICRPKLPPLNIQDPDTSSNTPAHFDHRPHGHQQFYPLVLPPILASHHSPTQRECEPQVGRAKQPPVESSEKVGGVAVYLDYDMETMVDFVTDMAQGMYTIFTSNICLADIDISRSAVHFRASPAHGLRNFVFQVLSSTRLPSSTILLGLLYMSKRMANQSRKGTSSIAEASIHSMLIVALILGSKFLDDNTFQNRSWSEVSGLSVRTLNFMEFQWLADIKWDMHIDQEDPDGFRLWRQHWLDFENRRVDVSLADSLRQTQVSDRYSERKIPSQHWPSPTSPVASQQGTSPIRNQLPDNSNACWNSTKAQSDVWRHARPEFTPPSAPETGPATPDNYATLVPDVYRGANETQALNIQTYPLQFYSARTPVRYCASQYLYRYASFTGPCFDGCSCYPRQEMPYVACA